MIKKDSLDLWEQRLCEYGTSGQTVMAWCKENSVTPRQFYYWRRKIRTEIVEEIQPMKWISLNCDLNESLDLGTNAIAIHIGQAIVEIRKGFDQELFREIMQVLQRL